MPPRLPTEPRRTPFTGPNDTMLPAGAALLIAGGLLVAATRYRARHARR